MTARGVPAVSDGVRSLGSYDVLKKTYELSFPEAGRARMVVRETTTICAATPVRFYRDRYRWTGHGFHQPVSAWRIDSDGQRTSVRQHGPSYVDDVLPGNRASLIDIGRTVTTGERVTIETTSMFIDEAGTFEPFLGFNVLEPGFEELVLLVSFKEAPASCRYYRVDPDSGEELDREDIAGNDRAAKDGTKTQYSKRIKNPNRGRHVMAWNDSDHVTTVRKEKGVEGAE